MVATIIENILIQLESSNCNIYIYILEKGSKLYPKWLQSFFFSNTKPLYFEPKMYVVVQVLFPAFNTDCYDFVTRSELNSRRRWDLGF